MRELIMEVRSDIRALDEKFDREQEKAAKEVKRIDFEVSKRPTRAEMLSLMAVAVSIAAFIVS